MRIRNYAFSILMYIICLTIGVYSQTVMEIENRSNEYYSARGIAETEQAARTSAIVELAKSISVTISSDTRMSIKENNESISSETSIQNELYSNMELEGISFISLPDENNKSVMFAYILKKEYENTIQQKIKDMCSELHEVEILEEEKKINNVIKDYYLIYLKLSIIPKTFGFISIQGDSIPNAKTWLWKKIKAYLDKISVIADYAKVAETVTLQIDVPFSLRYYNRPINNISLNIESPEKTATRKVSIGKTVAFLYSPSMYRIQSYKVKLSIYIERNDPDQVKALHEKIGIYSFREVDIDFRNVYSIDFDYKYLQKNTIKFFPRIKNLTYSKLQWNYGDGTEMSSDEVSIHQFMKHGLYNVVLKVNNQNDLIVKKYVPSNNEVLVTPHLSQENVPKNDSVKVDTIHGETSKNDPVENNESDSSKNEIFVIHGVEKIVNLDEKKDIQNDPQITKYPADQIPPVIQELIENKQWDKIRLTLSRLQKNKKIVFGSKKDFHHPEKCYVLVIEDSNSSLKALLKNEQNYKRIDILNNKEIENISMFKSGYYLIYVEVVL